ncbi:hypothetical protein CLAFUR0_14559 [Fulvia fulva]|nr:hypothetical protein CLAFUR0_14559 [Fulvia fulva]
MSRNRTKDLKSLNTMNCTATKEDGKRSVADWLTSIGVSLTFLGFLGSMSLLFNIGKTIFIFFSLHSRIPAAPREYFAWIIPDFVRGTVTVIHSTPSLAQPGLWSPSQVRFVSIPATVNCASQQSKRISNTTGPLITTERALEDGRIRARNPIRPSALLEAELSPSLLLTAKHADTTIPAKRRLHTHWMHIRKLRLTSRASPESVFSEDEQERYVVDLDLRTKPMLLAMEWPQFLWFVLALGVNTYCPEFEALGSIFESDSQEADLQSALTLASTSTTMGRIIKVSLIDNKLVGELFPKALHYNLQAALAFDNIMVWSEEQTGGRTKGPVQTFCRSLAADKSSMMRHITAIGSTLELKDFKPSQGITGSTVSDCGKDSTLAATWQWLAYTMYLLKFNQPAPVNEDLVEVRERIILELAQLSEADMEARWDRLKRDTDAPASLITSLKDVMLSTTKSSSYVSESIRLSSLWDKMATSCKTLVNQLRPAVDEAVAVDNTKNSVRLHCDEFGDLKAAIDKQISTIKTYDLVEPNDCASPSVEERSKLLERLQRLPVWEKLQHDTSWHNKADWSHLDLEALDRYRRFATICIVIAPWNRRQWPVWRPIKKARRHCSELTEILDDLGKDVVQDRCAWYELIDRLSEGSIQPGAKVFEFGGFEAPDSPVRKLMRGLERSAPDRVVYVR